MGIGRRHVLASALAALLASCGAKTGLLVPDASLQPDAGFDAGTCRPIPVALERRGAQIFFTIDRSNSMADTLDGREPRPGEPSRWEITGETLGVVLADADPILEIGAKFYPRVFVTEPSGPAVACSVDRGIDLVPARANAPYLLAIFRTTPPVGGTPTAAALDEVRRFIESQPNDGLPRFVILATDGGPNCNPDTGVPSSECLCTGTRDMCLVPEFGPYNCIDELRTLEVIRALFGSDGVPVYVIGIDDPTRPDLGDVLDRMAVAGGRPRGVAGERQFYSVRRPDDLRGALTTITESISRCVFTVAPAPGANADLEVRVGGVAIPRDPTHTDGWDFNDPAHRELTMFGSACERVTAGAAAVEADVFCPPEE
jgi:hypothetical protein